MVQSLPEASPAKWHLAHTAWFFESFVLREFCPVTGSSTRTFPGSSTAITRALLRFLRSGCGRRFRVLRWKRYCATGRMWMKAMERLLEGDPEPEALKRIELGVNHEEQHQELLLTDILHAFFTNPSAAGVSGDVSRRERRGMPGV
jgi:hypothetical protein